MSVRPAKTQISLDIRPVWSEISLCAQWVAKDPSFLHADSEDSDQTGWADAQADLSLRWAHSHFVGFVMSWLIFQKGQYFPLHENQKKKKKKKKKKSFQCSRNFSHFYTLWIY